MRSKPVALCMGHCAQEQLTIQCFLSEGLRFEQGCACFTALLCDGSQCDCNHTLAGGVQGGVGCAPATAKRSRRVRVQFWKSDAGMLCAFHTCIATKRILFKRSCCEHAVHA
jgi:hypothetical protein